MHRLHQTSLRAINKTGIWLLSPRSAASVAVAAQASPPQRPVRLRGTENRHKEDWSSIAALCATNWS